MLNVSAFLTTDNIQLSQPITGDYQVTEVAINALNYTEADACLHSSGNNSDVEKYLHAALSENTRRGYQADLAHFIAWGGSTPATPEAVSQYLAAHVGTLSPATLNRRLVAIGRAHTSQGLITPTKSDLVKTTLRGIRRTVGTAQRQVAPAVKEYLLAMVEGLNKIKGTRDKALLLVGFAGAFRRSELVSIEYRDIEFADKGLVVNLRRSKTDQDGQGRKVAIPYARGATCPVQALKQWLEVSGIVEGPIFRPLTRHGKILSSTLSAQAVAEIVKQRAKAIGLDPKKYSGHSLRAGLVTSAAQAGISSWKIRQQTGHKSDAMLERYIREANIFVDNAAGVL